MNQSDNMEDILASEKIGIEELPRPYPDELYIKVKGEDFLRACSLLHKRLDSPVMSFFAEDRRAGSGCLLLRCAFLNIWAHCWVFLCRDVDRDSPEFDSIAKVVYSASLFEREIKEMFGIEPVGNPDIRSLRLHDEIWPKGYHPLRKDFKMPEEAASEDACYVFKRVEGEGVFEVPVGPVHAGVIGPGHFRFSVAGEPIINLETRLGWTHRGIEKLLEGKNADEAVEILECISGDTSFGYSLAFCRGVEKILDIDVPLRDQLLRVLFLELERIYNHANDIGGIALDVGFSFPAQFASLMKEAILQLNQSICGSRYLKGINIIGGVVNNTYDINSALTLKTLVRAEKDLAELEDMLFSSISFMDRVDTTGVLRIRTARDLGITGLAARASGISLDLRKMFHGVYGSLSFAAAKEHSGDVAARLKVRFSEMRESMGLVRQCLERVKTRPAGESAGFIKRNGIALGYCEAWRGPVLVWTRLDSRGLIERCKIVDPSFHNWEGLSYAVLGNIIPDFPLCNKSFDLSYSGNDL